MLLQNTRIGAVDPPGANQGERNIMNEAKPVGSDSSADVTMGSEHQVQMGLVRALGSALESENPAGNANEILDQLQIYTNGHFLGEQLLMRLHAFAGYAQHCREHEALLDALASLQHDFEEKSRNERLDAFRVFEFGITRHIATSDNSLEQFIASI